MDEIESLTSLSDDDLNELLDLKQKIAPFCQTQSTEQRSLQKVTERKKFIQLCESLLNSTDLLLEERQDMIVMSSAMLEHSNELENELVKKNDDFLALLEQMRKYLSNNLYSQIVGGTIEAKTDSYKRQNLTIFFSDIVGFTDITDTLEPEQLSSLLNTYLNAMAKIASKWNGTIDKFIGDAVMIYFGDDSEMDDRMAATNCVMMALEMQYNMGLLREQWANKGIHHSLKIRIGINTGYCTIGNFGSEERIDYTIVGGNVNVASRLEHECPSSSILISGSTYLFVKDKVRAVSRGKIKVKGVAHAVDSFEVLGLLETSTEEADELNSHINIFANGFELKPILYNNEDSSYLEKEMIVKSLVKALNKLTN